MGVAFMGDRLFIVGGFDGQAYLNFIEAYDPLTNIWQQVKLSFLFCRHFSFFYVRFPNMMLFLLQFAPLPSGRAGACIAVVRDTVGPVVWSAKAPACCLIFPFFLFLSTQCFVGVSHFILNLSQNRSVILCLICSSCYWSYESTTISTFPSCYLFFPIFAIIYEKY